MKTLFKLINLKAITIFFVSMTLLLGPLITKASEKIILINEIAWMGTLASANAEWIELYNPTLEDIDISGWRIVAQDGSPSITLTGTIKAEDFFILERTNDNTLPAIPADQLYSGALGNSGEWLKLVNTDGLIIDEINASGGWPGGDNTTKQTMERSDDLNWHTSAVAEGTPKSTNSQPTPREEDENQETDNPTNRQTEQNQLTEQTNAKKGDIIISEILPNPIGADFEDEFIEIRNVSIGPVNLTGWTLENSAGQKFIIPAIVMWPKSISVFYRPQTKIAINNSKDKITLKNAGGKIIDSLSFSGGSPEGLSYQPLALNKWGWDTPNPSQYSEAAELPLPKIVLHHPKTAKVGDIVIFDASDSFDPNNENLIFEWSFSDRASLTGAVIKRIFVQAGKYEIILVATTRQGISSTEKINITITSNQLQPVEDQSSTQIKNQLQDQVKPLNETDELLNSPTVQHEVPFIFISEFLPYAVGPDAEEEFIELFSQHDKPIDLGGYKLDDAEGGSRPFIIPPATVIKPGQYLAFFRPQTKLALNNNGGDEVRFLSPDNLIIDAVSYETTKKGFSYIRLPDFDWDMTDIPTPGEINVFNPDIENNQVSATSTNTTIARPKILGTSTEEIMDYQLAKNKKRYLVAGLIFLLVILLSAGWKAFQQFKK